MKENTGQFWFQKDREQHFEEEVPYEKKECVFKNNIFKRGGK
jgi:hypothetical protein